MKTLLTAIAIVALASTAMAVPFGDYGVLALDVRDANEAFLLNTTGETISLIGYSITSQGGLLDPTAYVGIGETFNSDPMTYGPILGWGAGGMGKANPSVSTLAELSTGAPVTLPAGYALSIGNACPFGTDADIDISYVDGATQTIEGVVIPEPATMSLLALGGLAVARRRR